MTQDHGKHGKHGKHGDRSRDTNAPPRDVHIPEDRRATLKTLLAASAAAGFTLPDNWKRPIVQAVVLPAHAQTTDGQPPDEPSDDDDPPLLEICDATVIAASIGSNEGASRDLDVVASAFISAGCVDEEPDSRTFECELISEGETLAPSSPTPIPTDNCDGPDAPTDGCIVSCSVWVSLASPGIVEVDDQITMRFSFGGVCICSGVATVTAGPFAE